MTSVPPLDTNPLHIAGEAYDDYRARCRAAGTIRAASVQEWANADQVLQPRAQCAQEVVGGQGNWGHFDDQGFPNWTDPVTIPPDYASLQLGGSFYNQITAYPSAKWTYPGEYMRCANGDLCHWDGGSWAPGTT